MKFEEYMESKIQGYKELLDEEVINSLRKDFDMMDAYRRARETATDMAFDNNKSELDYTTTIEKNMSNEQRWKMILDAKIDQIRQELGLNEEKTTASHK